MVLNIIIFFGISVPISAFAFDLNTTKSNNDILVTATDKSYVTAGDNEIDISEKYKQDKLHQTKPRIYFRNVKFFPNKPNTLSCLVMHNDLLPEERVIMTKEEDDNIITDTKIMTLVKEEPSNRIYEYTIGPLTEGDYKYNCNLVYKYDENNKFSVKESKTNDTLYVIVRDNEILYSEESFETAEKLELMRLISKEKIDYGDRNLLKMTLPELEEMYGRQILKYKKLRAVRPK